MPEKMVKNKEWLEKHKKALAELQGMLKSLDEYINATYMELETEDLEGIRYIICNIRFLLKEGLTLEPAGAVRARIKALGLFALGVTEMSSKETFSLSEEDVKRLIDGFRRRVAIASK